MTERISRLDHNCLTSHRHCYILNKKVNKMVGRAGCNFIQSIDSHKECGVEYAREVRNIELLRESIDTEAIDCTNLTQRAARSTAVILEGT